MKNKLMVVGKFLRIIDKNGVLSLTNLVILVFMKYIIPLIFMTFITIGCGDDPEACDYEYTEIELQLVEGIEFPNCWIREIWVADLRKYLGSPEDIQAGIDYLESIKEGRQYYVIPLIENMEDIINE